MPTANPKPKLLPLFQRIEELAEQLPRSTAPDLLHYMQKKSYEKARLWLEGSYSKSKGRLFALMHPTIPSRPLLRRSARRDWRSSASRVRALAVADQAFTPVGKNSRKPSEAESHDPLRQSPARRETGG